MRQAAIYGGVMAAAIFFVGWVTGLGGAPVANAGFSLLMGLLAGLCFTLVQRFAAKTNKTEMDE